MNAKALIDRLTEGDEGRTKFKKTKDRILEIDQLMEMDFESFYKNRSAEIRDRIAKLEKEWHKRSDVGMSTYDIEVELGNINDELEHINGRMS
jgi:hypothetical protein